MIWGMVGNSHDASIAVYDQDKNFIKMYNSKDVRHSDKMIKDALSHGHPTKIVWYEKPFSKSIRQLYAGQKNPFKRNNVKKYLKEYGLNVPVVYVGHHHSHAAHYYNSGFDHAVILVIDSIGEWDTTTIWEAYENKLRKKYSVKYPHSLGLFYSSMTKRIGLVPQKDEGELEKRSKYIEEFFVTKGTIEADLIKQHPWKPLFTRNLHRGIGEWRSEFYDDHIAAATQSVFEDQVLKVSQFALNKLKSRNLVVAGGCAFNRGIRPLLKEEWENVYFPDNPGDGGSAETCVLAYLNGEN